MARTESKSIQVHPRDEQSQIDLMQKFHWSLLNSQEIKTVDNRLERRGDNIYQTSNTENYVKLVFSRDLDLPNLNEIKRLEEEFFSLSYPTYPTYPSAFGCLTAIGLLILLVVVGGFVGGVTGSGEAGLILGLISIVGAYVAYFNLSYTPEKKEADRMKAQTDQKIAQTKKRKQEIMAAIAHYD